MTFDNAIALLVRRGILTPAEDLGRERREASYAPGEAFDELQGLRERLAAVLAAR